MGTVRRRISRRLAAFLWIASAVGAYAFLAHGLPDRPHEDCAGPAHVACGIDAKAMLGKFRDAVADPGVVHTVEADGRGRSQVRGEVNVGLAPGASASALALAHGLTLSRVGGSLALLAGADDVQRACAALAADPRVRYAEPNFISRVAWTPDDPFFPLGGQRVPGLEAAWDMTQGDASVKVAVLDTGVDPGHPDLAGQLLPGFDFVNQTSTLSDDNGHGTAMVGIVAAQGGNGLGLAGVAPGCRVIPVKVADAHGQASAADVAAGIDYAIGAGARVINLSMGAPSGNQTLRDALNRAEAAGVLVVASAGNAPVHQEMFPAAYPNVLSVTAVSKDGELGFDAALAEGVDLGAAGEGLVTTLPGDVYCFVSGSSAAAAFSSGVAALCLSRDSTLSRAQLEQVLRHAQRPIAALAGLESVYRFGSLDPQAAVDRARATRSEAATANLRVYPAKPVPSRLASAACEVINRGATSLAGLLVSASLVNDAGRRIEIGAAELSLALGERRALRFEFDAPEAGSWRLETAVTGGPTARLAFRIDDREQADLRVVARSVEETPSGLRLSFDVENRGTRPAQNLVLRAEEISARGPLVRSGTPVSPPVSIPSLAVGSTARGFFSYTTPTPAPSGIVRFRLGVDPLAGETAQGDNAAHLDLLVGDPSATLRGLYQQSNGVDVVAEAVWRVDPARPYVPLLVFVPSKGGRTPTTQLDVKRITVDSRSAPSGPSTRLYEDTRAGAPLVAPAGLVIVDELGAPRPTPDLFGDRVLDANGHHDVLRIPRAALGVAASPAASEERYLDVEVQWEQKRILFFTFGPTRSGTHRAVSRVRFAPAALPSLPGDNHHHDVHYHSIAEWYFGSLLDIFAPRKAYGGPLQMMFESGYAMGLIGAPTPQAARDRLMTTDHNNFNNRTIPDPDGPDHRPPFGPQSPTQQPGLGQLEAYRAVLGRAAGEEVTFEQLVPIPSVSSSIDPLLNLLPGAPMGAHMLVFDADHVEGAWHGGGYLIGPGNPRTPVVLEAALADAAKARQQTQANAFAYAAHPWGGMGWSDANLERNLGLTPGHRTRDAVHDASGEFVLKGLQFFNGRSPNALPNSAIDFNDLDPWVDPAWQAGRNRWDSGVWRNLTRWHELQAKTLDYAFVSDPEVRFIRKLYHAGGSDAHGSFNFNVSRAATPLNIQSTYSVSSKTWYGVRTYCLGDGKAGASSEARWLEAFRDGNSVVTDGPLASLSLDANGRFDSTTLRWHDGSVRLENSDGSIGGDGPLDGGLTALVRRGADSPVFGYRYTSTAEWGPIASVLLYKTEAGNPNPTRSRGSWEQVVGVNEFALGGADQDLEQRLDPTQEGPVDALTAFSLGAFTVGNPDLMDLGVDGYRAYTNPVFAAPYDVTWGVASVDSANAVIPAGALKIEYTFEISLEPSPVRVDVQSLDANGDSPGNSAPALSAMVPATGSGWSDRPGIKSSVLTLVNQDPIPLYGAGYPSASERTFVVFWRDPPKDYAGNPLNRIASLVQAPRLPAPPGAGGSTAGVSSGSGTTAPGSSAASSGSGGGGSSGCAIAPASAVSFQRSWAQVLLVLVLALGLARRRVRGGAETSSASN